MGGEWGNWKIGKMGGIMSWPPIRGQCNYDRKAEKSDKVFAASLLKVMTSCGPKRKLCAKTAFIRVIMEIDAA